LDSALFHDLHSFPTSHYSVWGVISAHDVTSLKHDDW